MLYFVIFIFRSSRISPFRISSWRLRKRRKTLYATLETRSNQHWSFTSFIFNPFPMQEIWQVSFYLLRIYGKIWFRVNWYTLLKLLLMHVLEAKFSLRMAWTKLKKNWLVKSKNNYNALLSGKHSTNYYSFKLCLTTWFPEYNDSWFWFI